MKNHLKRCLATVLTFAMVFTMVPSTLAQAANGTGSGQARDAVEPALHYDMSHADGKLTDCSGNGFHGTLQSITDSDFIEKDGKTVLNFDGTAKYVEIPAGVLKDGSTESFTIEARYTDSTKSAAWLFTLGTTVGAWPNVTNYLFVAPYVSDGSYNNKMLAAIKDGSTEKRYPTSKVIGGDNTGEENIVTVVFDKGNVTYYLNGAASDVTESGFKIQDILSANSTEDCIGYIGKSLYKPDPDFKGTVNDFKIYKQALTAEQVAENHRDIAQRQVIKELEGKLLGAMLNKNTSAENILTDLSFPESMDDVALAWTPSDLSIIDASGKIVYTGEDTVDVNVTVKGTYNGAQVIEQTFALKVANANAVERKAFNEMAIPNATDIRGNITLLAQGTNGAEITWASSNEAVISSAPDGSKPAGVVTRQDNDTKVTLTATLKQSDNEISKTFEVIVKAKAQMDELTDYIFAYFPYTNTKDERIYFGISEDGLNFTALNDGKYVLESKLGTHGLRDPFIIRSPEGDRFYLIATDLTVAGVTQDGVNYPGQGWSENQVSGSQKIMVWESTDLVNWSDQRECKVARDNAGCTWAPEAYWDDETGQYVVFWASKTGDDNYAKQRLYYATTRDFYNFSEAQVWIEQEGSVIDTTVIKAGDYYYRYTKNEAGNTVNGTPSKRIFCERSKSLTSTTWEHVHANSLDVSGGQIEGGCIFKINTDDVENAKKIAALKGYNLTGDDIYCLAADATGKTIFPGLSDDITTGSFHVLGTDKSASIDGTPLYSMPEPDASHGTIMPITSEEYNNLRLKWDSAYATAAADFVKKAEDATQELTLPAEVTSDITLPDQTTNGAKVTWESSNEAAITSAGKVTRPAYSEGDITVDLTATITVAGNETVRDQIKHKTFSITVAEEDPTYYTVKFNANGGSAINNATVAQGDRVTKPANPTRSGYTFDGWYLGNAKYDFNTAVTSNITLTAHWKAVSFTVKFDSNGGSKVSSKSVQSGKKVSQPKNPTRSKYTFVGWYKGSKKYNFSTKVTSNITLKAKWKKVTVATPTVKSANNSKSKKCDVILKKVSGAKGYQVTYATDKNFKKNKKTISVKATGKATLTKLKKGQKYYIKARAYKLDSKGSKVYGSYSKVKTVNIRK